MKFQNNVLSGLLLAGAGIVGGNMKIKNRLPGVGIQKRKRGIGKSIPLTILLAKEALKITSEASSGTK